MVALADPGAGLKNWAGNTLDRTWRTGLQVLAGYLAIAQTMHNVDWVVAVLAALFAMLVSALTRLIDMPSLGMSWPFQIAERLVKTFCQSMLVMIGVATAFEQVDWGMALHTSLLAALGSVVTSVLTTRAGESEARGNPDLTVPASMKATSNSEVRATGGGGY